MAPGGVDLRELFDRVEVEFPQQCDGNGFAQSKALQGAEGVFVACAGATKYDAVCFDVPASLFQGCFELRVLGLFLCECFSPARVWSIPHLDDLYLSLIHI